MGGEALPHYVELMQRQLSQFGRIGATRIVATPDVAAIAASTTSQPQVINWRDDGIVVALYGSELAGTAPKFAMTRVRVQVSGSEDLFTDGQAGVFISMLALFGGAQNWFPILRRVRRGVQWVVTYQNQDAGATATPSTSFAFIADPDVARMQR